MLSSSASFWLAGLPRAATMEEANGSAASSSREKRKPLKLDLGNLTEKNIGQLKKLNTYTFPVTYKDQFYEDLKKRLEYCRLGFYADVLVGSICCRPEERKEGGKALYIMTLSVLKPYRGRSLASQLVQWIVDKAQKEESVKDDVREVYLHVQTSNKTALTFYHKFDFKVTEEIKDYYQNIDPPDCYVLRRPVNGHELSQEVMNIGVEA
eukprot:s1972_g5.t1